MQRTMRSGLTVMVALLVEMTVVNITHTDLIGLVAGLASLVVVWVVLGLTERK